jgi:alkylhydroperoxidase family enzyme
MAIVFPARMPAAFGRFYRKASKLDRKLEVPPSTAVLVRERVASVNQCTPSTSVSGDRLDALRAYATSPDFTAAERAALDFATELAWGKRVEPETFELVGRYYSERQICDLVWLVASEHLHNMTTIALGTGFEAISREPVEAA